MSIISIGMVSIFALSASGGQDINSMSTPYGQERGSEFRPMTVSSRDTNGTRVVVNGRIIDAGESSATPQGYARHRQPSSSMGESGTLRRTTLNSMAIGNSVQITGVRNSVITINQTNNGTQTANAVGF